ncbi:Eukaryotic initiation factor 4E-1 [Operophtera brumata]|uniref:Eukaryotic initiation factor 4E-1 n=1 Tax=Operophtera brumata TaxID=104452 RepID=A0A0L7LDR8_OPEBR|nr:Eukaryotic initiation factor 4E-1 [Operophtera brumata]
MPGAPAGSNQFESRRSPQFCRSFPPFQSPLRCCQRNRVRQHARPARPSKQLKTPVEGAEASIEKQNDAPRETKNDAPREKQNDASREKQNDAHREKQNDTPREKQNDAPREKQNDAPREKQNDAPREKQNDPPREKQIDAPREKQNDAPKEKKNDAPREKQNDALREKQKDAPREKQNDASIENQNDVPFGKQNDAPREKQIDAPREKQNDAPREKQNDTNEGTTMPLTMEAPHISAPALPIRDPAPPIRAPEEKPGPEKIPEDIKHPLENTWDFWLFTNENKNNWSDNLKNLTTFETVEDYWCLYHHMKLPSALSSGQEYSIFKKGINPMWEDEANKSGGRLIMV